MIKRFSAIITAVVIALAIAAASASAYNGHAGCPNANSGQVVSCAWHTHWRFFTIFTPHNCVTIWVSFWSGSECYKSWYVDTGVEHDGRASYRNNSPYPVYGMTAYYTE